jgi:hypothetical protein
LIIDWICLEANAQSAIQQIYLPGIAGGRHLADVLDVEYKFILGSKAAYIEGYDEADGLVLIALCLAKIDGE